MNCGSIDIKCPDCGELASFEEPFEFLGRDRRPSSDQPVHQWGGWSVVERFPSQFAWKAPSGSCQFLRWGGTGNDGYPLLTYGLVLCPACHANRKHRLSWPNDAYWQWIVRGQVLWAWDRHHAQQILNYIGQEIRPSRYAPGLRYIPSHFLSAKVRSEVVRKIEASLRT